MSAEVDERTLREIYLASFERAVAGGAPWTVMCAYNRVNGTYASQNHWLLTQVLREEWGWDGLVVSDWGAVRDRVAALPAGLDLEMPNTGPAAAEAVVAAVRAGDLDEAVVDAGVRNVLRLIERTHAAVTGEVTVEAEAHHALAREAAAAAAILLRNEPVPDGAGSPSPILPLAGASAADLVVLGEFARTPRYQGAGSSLVNPTRLDSALEALEEALGAAVPFAPGFTITEGPEGQEATQSEEELLAEAVDLAQGAKTVLLFAGLPAEEESEGYDRTGLSLPEAQVRLIRAVAQVNPRVVVVLAGGGAVTLSEWDHEVPAVLEGWLGGQAGASGIVDVLLGEATPSGRLAETIPHRLQDVPAYGNFPGEQGTVRYGEGQLVGYRWYDSRAIAPAYPFGFGLSYTAFAIDQVEVDLAGEGSTAQLTVTARVTNTGARQGAHVVQVYTHATAPTLTQPEQRLVGYAKVALEPGESRKVRVVTDSRAFAVWNPALGDWQVEGGAYEVRVGSSSRDVAATEIVTVIGSASAAPLTTMSTWSELLAHPATGEQVRPWLADMPADLASMAGDMPAQVLVDFGMMPQLNADSLAELIAASQG